MREMRSEADAAQTDATAHLLPIDGHAAVGVVEVDLDVG